MRGRTAGRRFENQEKFMRTSCLMLPAFLALFLALGQSLCAQSPIEQLEKKKDEVVWTDPESIYELAVWAMNSKSSKVRREGRKLMKEVLELDEDHEGAREKLGFVKVGEKWYTRKKAAAARKALVQDKMKSRGYVWYKGGWIKKTEKRRWNKKWEKNAEDVWRSYEEVMREKGYTLYKGKWIRMSKKDLERMEFHRKQTGEDIMIVSTEHFALHTSIPVAFVEKYSKLCEEVYDWYMKTFNVPEGRAQQFFGRPVHIWTFSDSQQFQDWVTYYSEQYKFTKEDIETFRERPSGWLLPGKVLITIVAEQPEDIENSLLHQLGVLLQYYNIARPIPAWVSEAFGHLVEELFSGIKFGRVNMSTKAKYAGNGGIVSKAYNTKDGRDTIRSLVKAREWVRLAELSKKSLNNLNNHDLATGFSVTEWLFNHNRERYMKFLEAMKRGGGDPEQNVLKGITEGIGVSVSDLEEEWARYVKKHYKK